MGLPTNVKNENRRGVPQRRTARMYGGRGADCKQNDDLELETPRVFTMIAS